MFELACEGKRAKVCPSQRKLLVRSGNPSTRTNAASKEADKSLVVLSQMIDNDAETGDRLLKALLDGFGVVNDEHRYTKDSRDVTHHPAAHGAIDEWQHLLLEVLCKAQRSPRHLADRAIENAK